LLRRRGTTINRDNAIGAGGQSMQQQTKQSAGCGFFSSLFQVKLLAEIK
jgi:hypothetical protein